MEFLEILRQYFAGEKAEALYFIVPIGILCVAFAVVVFQTHRGGFMWGVCIPFALLGLAAIAAGGAVALRTDGQAEQLIALHGEDARRFVEQELPRMQQVNRNWPIYVTVWLCFGLGGLALRFVLKADWAHGLGIALVFFAGVGLIIDGFAERRAGPYTKALEDLAEATAKT